MRFTTSDAVDTDVGSGEETEMTETTEPTRTAEPRIISDALEIIDNALGDFFRRELVSSVEVTDVLLDVRTLLRRGDEVAELPVAGKADQDVARA